MVISAIASRVGLAQTARPRLVLETVQVTANVDSAFVTVTTLGKEKPVSHKSVPTIAQEMASVSMALVAASVDSKVLTALLSHVLTSARTTASA